MSYKELMQGSGTSVVMASSYDARYPPQDMIGRKETFWITGGMYPQECIIQLNGLCTLSQIKSTTMNVKHMVIERCDKSIPASWEKILDLELDDNDGGAQIETNAVSQVVAYFLKVKILEGWSDFSIIKNLSVMGLPTSDLDAKSMMSG